MSPFLSRLRPQDRLAGRRGDIYELIQEQPGIHFVAVAQETGLAFGAATYHLRALETLRYVASVKVGRHRRYYPVGIDDHAALTRRAYAADPGYLRIMVDVETLPGARRRDLQGLNPGVSRQAIAYRLRRLQSVGVLESARRGGSIEYTLTSEGNRVLEAERFAPSRDGHCSTECPPPAQSAPGA